MITSLQRKGIVQIIKIGYKINFKEKLAKVNYQEIKKMKSI